MQLQQKARANIVLTVGSTNDSVEVVATGVDLKTDDAAVGQVVDNRRITELPVNGRNLASRSAEESSYPVAVGRIHRAAPGSYRWRAGDSTVAGRRSPARKEGTSMKKAALLNTGSKYDPRLRALIGSAVSRQTSPHPMLERPVANRSRKIRVMIVDNQAVVRIGVAAVLNAQPDMSVVAETGNGRESVQFYQEHQPDITLMDLRLPEMSGLEAMQTIRKGDSRSRFIVLTNCDGDEHIHRALNAGATAYLLKAVSADELLQAIRNVHAGLRWLSRPVVEALARRPPNCDLTLRERQIVGLIVGGMSNRQIAEALGLTLGTVKWYVNGLLERLCVIDRTQAAISAVRRGIVDLVELGDSRWKTTTGYAHGAA